jgi:chromate transporter
MDANNQRKPLAEIARLFLKLGLTAFGGPAVHIAMMEDEVVKKRQWVTHEHFLDLIGATNLIPGPNSTEMAMHIGHERGGWKGLIVAGCCFIGPAVLITAVFAIAYQRYGTLPSVEPFIYGIKPAIISVIVALMISLGKKALKSVTLGVIGVIAAVLSIIGVNEIYVLFGSGFLGMALYALQNKKFTANSFLPLTLLQIKLSPVQATGWKLFWIFLKVGSILFGSGYVLFAFLDSELVATGLLTKKQLIDAIAVGQFTPGPVFSSATFIGWQIGGLPGAVGATLGIFLPSFLFVAFLQPLIPFLRKSTYMSAFLDTVNMASVAIILAVCVDMGRESITDWRALVIATAGFIVSFTFKKLNSAFVVLGGAVMGYLLWLV